MDCVCQAPLSMGILRARILEQIAMLSSRESSQPKYQTQVPALRVDSLPSEPPGKPKNTGVGSLSLLQGMFPAPVMFVTCNEQMKKTNHSGLNK